MSSISCFLEWSVSLELKWKNLKVKQNEKIREGKTSVRKELVEMKFMEEVVVKKGKKECRNARKRFLNDANKSNSKLLVNSRK